MPRLILTGCSPEPLMGYLKALGIFRIIAEQADPKARGAWVENALVLDSKLDRESLRQFLLEQYQPTPVLAPWNGGGGFYGSGAEPLDAIADSTAPRLATYRETIRLIRTLVLKGIVDKPNDEGKDALLAKCRSELPDSCVTWLDCCFVLGEERTSYFPLLGTGGNDGRLDFTNNFMQRLADVISLVGEAPPKESAGWFDAAVFADNLTPLGRSAIGQFNPGGIGGPNGVQGSFEADSRVNPWDFVLMIEGILVFAGALARRLGTSGLSRSAFPFSVESVAVGYGSATNSEETTDGSRAELWLPLWDEPATLHEVKNVFAEGRAQIGQRQAKDAVEFAIAVSTLGVNRGIKSFSRYGFLKRNGLAFLAAPLGRFAVTPHPVARLLEDSAFTDWIDQLRRACRDKERTPARYLTALRQIDQAIFRFANRSDSSSESDRVALVAVLRALGRAERSLAAGLTFCEEKYIRPLQRLDTQWLKQADDGSPEFRLAASLAGMRGQGAVPSLRAYLEPCELKGDYVSWAPGNTHAVWSKRDLTSNLVDVFRRRQLDAFRDGQIGVPLESTWNARSADIIAFLYRETDDAKLEELLWALVGIKWSATRAPDREAPTALPFEFAVPRLLAQPASIRAQGEGWIYSVHFEVPNVLPDRNVFNSLLSADPDAVENCVVRAAQRLEAGGLFVVGRRNRKLSGRPLLAESSIDPHRLLAAMAFPLSTDSLQKITYDVLYFPESEE